MRTLEASAREHGGQVVAGPVPDAPLPRPGAEFLVVDALLTNFHLPRSTLLMLVSAFAGRERVLAAYREAVADGYRFFSYGDAMLIALTGRGIAPVFAAGRLRSTDGNGASRSLRRRKRGADRLGFGGGHPGRPLPKHPDEVVELVRLRREPDVRAGPVEVFDVAIARRDFRSRTAVNGSPASFPASDVSSSSAPGFSSASFSPRSRTVSPAFS